MSLKIKLIVRTVPIWPILGKMAADDYPQEGICIPGAAHHLSPVRRKIPGLYLLLPLGREKQLRDRVGQEPMHFLARTQSSGEGRVKEGSLPLSALSEQFLLGNLYSGKGC